jgi:hypothetical protein
MGSLVVVGRVKAGAKKGAPPAKALSKKAAKTPVKTAKGSAKAKRPGGGATSKRSAGVRKRGK